MEAIKKRKTLYQIFLLKTLFSCSYFIFLSLFNLSTLLFSSGIKVQIILASTSSLMSQAVGVYIFFFWVNFLTKSLIYYFSLDKLLHKLTLTSDCTDKVNYTADVSELESVRFPFTSRQYFGHFQLRSTSSTFGSKFHKYIEGFTRLFHSQSNNA